MTNNTIPPHLHAFAWYASHQAWLRSYYSCYSRTHHTPPEETPAQCADLIGANLAYANLRGANLIGANLTVANLTGANLAYADFTRAYLAGADFAGADFTGANLAPIRDDLYAVLAGAPTEVPGLRQALIAGHIDGTTYEGPCACLVGTLAKVAGCAHTALPGITPDASRPIERFFLAIKPGDTPANHPGAALVLEWIDAWLATQAPVEPPAGDALPTLAEQVAATYRVQPAPSAGQEV